jgi:hypothetical protein
MLPNQLMLGALSWKSIFVTFGIASGRSSFTVFVVALLLHWPQHRFALGTIFDFFPMVSQQPTASRTVKIWLKTLEILQTL